LTKYCSTLNNAETCRNGTVRTKDWISFDKFIKEAGGGPTIGIGVASKQDSQDLLSQAIELFANKLTQVIAQNQEIIEKTSQRDCTAKVSISPT